jgi:hypothetical protein
MARSAADHNQPAFVVSIVGPGKRQRTRAAECYLNRRVMVDGQIRKRTGNHEPARPQVRHTHSATVALFCASARSSFPTTVND